MPITAEGEIIMPITAEGEIRLLPQLSTSPY